MASMTLQPTRGGSMSALTTIRPPSLAENEPVISVDTKKKELVGDFKNAGREWRPEGNPEEVRVHDFLIKELGRAVPYERAAIMYTLIRGLGKEQPDGSRADDCDVASGG